MLASISGKKDLSRAPSTEGPEPLQPEARHRDGNLCIPSLNFVGWDAFRAAGDTKELFRQKEYYAIDVLVGEPMIEMETYGNGQRRRNKAFYATENSTDTTRYEDMTRYEDAGEAPLPERIRINSIFLTRIISYLTKVEPSSEFLMFRPFRSLVYYEQEFRDHLAKWEKPSGTGYLDLLMPQMQRLLQCFISFIDNYIKKKQHYIASDRCKSVAFTDLAFLYIPGDIVITNDGKQAARVTKVANTRHRVKNRDEGGLDFWKDDRIAEFDDNPVFVFVNYVDFNGTSMGSASKMFTLSRSYFDRKVDGREKITSLPIYPLRCSEDIGLRDALIERGKMFLEVARVKHMHYSGLALGTKEDIDSQVVIDFEEAFERHPKWRPHFRRAADEALHRLTTWESDPSDDKDLVEAVATHRKSRTSQCVKECCLDEKIHNDEHLENQVMEEFIVRQMEAASLAFTTKPLKDIDRHTDVADEDFLIMAFRVFGFALRSRKWCKYRQSLPLTICQEKTHLMLELLDELDLTNMSEVAILGDGEGLDQLVLPPGHVDMVKSMIRQHFRDKKLASAHGDKLDVVRGKGMIRYTLIYALLRGRGLIMLLHGVPGVGKTSTAECVADSFRRPLFQITSGDLGTTAEEVEEALEENFNLANRWNSILLIDEADIFLGERTREDFIRNSLVAVFLRMMEYYTGVLFLTTNRVGVFDEAFTSRIHISLYYPPLERDATRQVFQKNWERIQSRYEKNNRKLEIDQPEITQFAMDYFDANKDGRWNGRQIRNAFQSALALAELDALGTDDLLDESDHGRTVVLGKKNFETVAHAYKGFLNYMKQVYGADTARRARENLLRYDAFGMPKIPNALTTRLKVADPGPPVMSPPRASPGPRQQWPSTGPPSQAGYGYREPQPSTYYQPQPPPPSQQQYYPERYDYQDQRPRHMPAPDSYAQPPPQDRYADSYARGPERYAAGPERLPQTPEQQFRRSAPRESGFPGREDDPR
ncbi:hypothetical protein PG988_007958 [Apiospora saccharicola]